jgi:hypothetical protein
VTISDLDVLQQPRRGPPVGVVSGRVQGAAARVGAILLALNGTVVTVAPVETDGRFRTLLPLDAQRTEGNDVQAWQVVNGVTTQLELS